MKKEMIFSICLILVAIIGFGCVSAADNSTSGVDDLNQMTVDENTEHVDVNQVSENSGVDDIASQVRLNSTEKYDRLDENSQNSVGLNDSNKMDANVSQQEKLIISTADGDKVVPGNEFTDDEVKDIIKYSKFYREHNFNLKALYLELGSYVLAIENRADFDHFVKFMVEIHNTAVTESGCGKLYDVREMYNQLGLIFARAILD